VDDEKPNALELSAEAAEVEALMNQDPILDPGSAGGQALAGVIVAAAVATVAPPVAAVVVAGLTPVLAKKIDTLTSKHRDIAAMNAELLLANTEEHSDASLEAVLDGLATDPRKVRMFGDAMLAAAATTCEDKIKLLASVLANAAPEQDSVRLDRDALMLDIVRDLEAPHILLLSEIRAGTGREQDGSPTGVSEATLAKGRVGDLDSLMQPLLRVLDRNGLIAMSVEGNGWDVNMADDIPPDSGTNEWAVTLFGRQLLERLDGMNERQRP
jgi:hypothetical protein